MSSLETDCLSLSPIPFPFVNAIYRREGAASDTVRILCRSHERLRAERDGADLLLASDQKEIERVLELLKLIGEGADLHGFEDVFNECCDRLRKLVPKVVEDDE